MSEPKFFPPLLLSSTQVGVTTLNLYEGLKLKGDKRWHQARQDLEVDINHIDWETDCLNGVLTIKRFEKVLKVAYFEGEIIGKNHSFLTKKWGVDAEIDEKHWETFDWQFNYTSYDSEEFDSSILLECDHVFMRWKEVASKANVGRLAPGFYYVCLTKSTGTCDGIYYEKCCCQEWNQDTFKVKKTPQRSFPVYQFR